eukprot:Gregarina_sp_Poly_1__4451@NODE_239_length_10907_cov_182_631458_g210_i0_p2_GENE_NODE_239_length_10907_cov_182_631458_g210_i0NODE_239_length_10907_cov_182_631458_g210_i0_p2_ORF_typecomplete_len688_score116_99RRM_1/PF00076_22/1_9e18SPOC/PF07744_13/3_5e14RRM_5/PF13893_6/2_5e12Limkainb1/PF11608_8/1_2e06RRM_Rrp7/PF17799_1/5_2e05RRM_8/PF11835_8/0_00031RRM_7/PF16367_5/0_0007RRM_occluded/PF16842_5/0_0028RRM_occluded/PF16842_5/9_3e03RL/PF17797_1/0_014RRM_3/PF08777_11/0_028PHM7_cyt/PF14703_6/19PHM7_cyt/PF1
MQGYSGVEANPNLYVHNVPKDSNEEELRHLFGQYGTVERVRLKVNQKVGPHAVYAFVTFSSTLDAQRALSKLQGTDVRGRALRIEFQRTTVNPTASAAAGGGSSSYGFYNHGNAWDGDGSTATTAPSPEPSSRTPQNTNFSTISSLHSSTSQGAPRNGTEPHSSSYSVGGTSTPGYFGAGGDAGASRFHHNDRSRSDHMWGVSSARGPVDFGGGGGGGWNRQPTASDDSNLMPPYKRGRFHSPNSQRQRPRSPSRSAAVMGPDHSAAIHPQNSQGDVLALWGQLKELVSQTHPHALGLVETLGDALRPDTGKPPTSAAVPNVLHPTLSGSERWPYGELNAAQRTLLRDGALTLNQENNRYLVRLSPLLAPLKPAMFGRRASAPQSRAGDTGFSAPQSRAGDTGFSAPQSRAGDTGFSAPPARGGDTGFSAQPYVAPSAVLPRPQTQSQQTELPSQTQATAVASSLSSDEATWLEQLSGLPVTPVHSQSVVWQGTLARNEKKKMPVCMKRLAGFIDHYLPATMSVLNISHRSALEEMWKKKVGAIGILEPETPEVSRAFQEYITYFKDKNRAGVARLERADYQMVYLLPIGLAELGDVSSHLPTTSDILLAIVGRPPASKTEGAADNSENAMHAYEEDGSKQSNETAADSLPQPNAAGSESAPNGDGRRSAGDGDDSAAASETAQENL